MHSIWDNAEKRITDQLQSSMGGKREVRVPSGRIDLLTDTFLIEVKKLQDWKSGLGQIVIYAPSYPYHKKKLYLFDRRPPLLSRIKRIIDACASQDIEVNFLHDLGFDPNCDYSFVVVEVGS